MKAEYIEWSVRGALLRRGTKTTPNSGAIVGRGSLSEGVSSPHAALSSQLRIPSLTPSQVIQEQQLTSDEFPSQIPAAHRTISCWDFDFRWPPFGRLQNVSTLRLPEPRAERSSARVGNDGEARPGITWTMQRLNHDA
jgi:hypothetical protein